MCHYRFYIILLLSVLALPLQAQLNNSGRPNIIDRDDEPGIPFSDVPDSNLVVNEVNEGGATVHPLGLQPNPIIRKDTRFTYDDLIWREIDTTLLGFHNYMITDEWKWPHAFLGIVGQNYYSLVFQNERETGFQTGFNEFSRYWYTAKNARYYNTKVPFTSVYYNLGPNVENNARVIHSQNVGPYYNFAVDYRLTNAQGAFQNQKTLMHNLNINNWYNSKNHRYTLLFAFMFNRLQLEENGGIAIDLYSPENANTGRDLVPVNLATANNDINNKGLNLKQIFYFGSSDSVKINDSTTVNMVQRKHALSYNFNYDNWRYEYEDPQASNGFFEGLFFDSTATLDSSKFWSTQHTFRWENTANQLARDSGYSTSALRYFATLDYRYTKFRNLDILRKWHNLSFSAGLAGSIAKTNKWKYGINGRIYVSPNDVGDFLVDGFLFWKINDKMNLRATLQSQRASATQKENEFRSNHFVWQNDFNPVFTNSVGLIFRCDHGDIDGTLTWHNVQRFIYLDEQINYQQANNNINILAFSAGKGFDWKNFYLHTGIIAQYITDRTKINLPQFMIKQRMHYKGGFAKGKLTAHLGIDIRYQTNYFGDAYNPAIRAFYRQNSEELRFYPIIDAYFEIFVKRARFFLLMEHVNQGMFARKGYFVAPNFGAQDRAFKFGLSWQFYN